MEERNNEEFINPEDIVHVSGVLATEDLSEFLFEALIDFGLVPTEEETDLIADLLFDYLIHRGFISELDIETEDE